MSACYILSSSGYFFVNNSNKGYKKKIKWETLDLLCKTFYKDVSFTEYVYFSLLHI